MISNEQYWEACRLNGGAEGGIENLERIASEKKLDLTSQCQIESAIEWMKKYIEYTDELLQSQIKN